MKNGIARIERGAIHVSAMDQETADIIRQAREVLDHTADTLNAPYCTLRAARFAAVEVSRSLRSMLDLVADMTGEGTDSSEDVADTATP